MEHTGSGLLYLHHATVATLGAWGIIEGPSPSVESVLGGALASGVWSLMFLVFGLSALFCRFASKVGVPHLTGPPHGWRPWRWPWRRHPLDFARTEAFSIVLIGGGYALFSVMVVLSALDPPIETGAIQTALALFASSVFLGGCTAIYLALARRERIRGNANTQAILTEATRQVRRPYPEE